MTTRKKATKRKTARAAVLNPVEFAFAHLLVQGKSAAEAGAELGLTSDQAPRLYARQSVQQYLTQYRAIFAEKFAEYEVSALIKRRISRESIAEKLMALADMPPERTRGSLDAQVDALRALSDLLGLKFDPKMLPATLAGMTDEQLAAYAGPAQ